jgi:propanol-preferring alcohol dehydrogenase
MHAMVLQSPRTPLQPMDLPTPEPGARQVLIRIAACGVCRTDLHVVDGELAHPKLPIIPGHEIVGRVVGVGRETRRFREGDRIGVPWLASTCGHCPYCQAGQENLCDAPLFTGYTRDGGYAQYAIADEDYCFLVPPRYGDVHAAPLLCAGLIGYRSLVRAGDAKRLGIYGFGAAAHIIAQVARQQGREVYAFTRTGDAKGQQFARDLGAVWAGGSTELPPEPLDAAIIFAPVGALVPAALAALRKGGTVVCAGIHMSDIPSFPYHLLWQERTVTSVANLTRRDGEEFFRLIAQFPVHTEVQPYPLARANEALADLRSGQVHGAAVLVPE